MLSTTRGEVAPLTGLVRNSFAQERLKTFTGESYRQCLRKNAAMDCTTYCSCSSVNSA